MIARIPHRAGSLVAVVALALGMLAFTATAASAESASATVTIDSSTSTGELLATPGGVGTGCVSTGTKLPYQIVQFTLDVTSNDTVSVSVQPTSGLQADVAVYENAYFPDDPTVDCDDNAVDGSAPGVAVSTSDGWGAIGSTPLQYYMEAVVWAASGTGDATVTITTDGTDLTIIPPASTSTDTTPPVVSVPATVTQEATSAAGAPVSYTATATDDVDGALTPICTPASGSTFPIGTTQVTCMATDSSDNVGSNSFDVVVRDTTAPTWTTKPADQTVEATGPTGAVATWTAAAHDAVTTSPPVTCAPLSGSTFALGTTQVTCVARDDAGNQASTSFTVKVVDTTAPTIHTPSVPTTEATNADGATVTYPTPTATDAVDGTDPVVCDHAGGATYPIGTTQVTCTAQDEAGNQQSAHFDVVVADTTAPTIGALTDVSAEATSADGATVTYTTPTATDAVDGTDPVTCTPASGGIFAIGTTTVTCAATDGAGNRAQKSFGVTVSDTSAPLLTLPADVTAEATGPDGAAVAYDAPSATDAVDGVRPVTCDHASGATFPLGHTTVTCSASDATGHTATATFTVTVRDTTPPTLTTPSRLSVAATSPGGATVTYPASAVDAVSGPVATTCTPASGSHFGVGTTRVACSATDAAGNTGRASFAVTVRGVRDPRLLATLSSSVRPGSTGWYRAPVTVRFACTAGTATVTSCPSPVTLSRQGTHHLTRTISASDGGTASVSTTVRIDHTAPRVTLRGATAGATYLGPSPTRVTCTAHDSLSGVAGCTVRKRVSGMSVRWTAVARDRAGNVTRRSLRYTVQPAYVVGVPTQDGRAVVQAGHSYQLRAYSTSPQPPTYLSAARAGGRPTPPPTPFRAAGGGWWTLSVRIDPAMAGHDWVVGVQIDGRVDLLALRVR